MEIHGINKYMEYIQQNFKLESTLKSDYVLYTIPKEIGNGCFELYHSQGQFQVWITHAQTNQDMDMSYSQDENTYIGLAYVETDPLPENLKEKSPASIQTWRTSRSLPSDNMVYGMCKADIPLHAVNIILFRDFFDNCSGTENTEEYFDILKTIQNFDEQTFMHELYPVLADILHCPYKGTSKKLFLKSRVYDIAARLISLCDTESRHPNVILGKFDIKQIRSIPHILEENMENPPSISRLSRMVALNEFKLKAGFKKIFNTTIYEYLRQLRTEKAIELMKKDFTLEQISKKVGYRSIRGFSQAFTKCTGITPAEWRKQRSMTFPVN